MTRRARKVKTKVAARIQLQGGGRDVKAVEIEVVVVNKVVLNVLVDEGSGFNILPEHTMKLGLSQSPAMSLGMIKDCKINTSWEEYVATFHVIKMHSNKDTFPSCWVGLG